MKPVSSNIKTNNKCLNPVSTKCVTWDGPEITCLDGTVLCKGQSVETTLYTIATKLCQVIDELNLEGINPCINNISDGTSVNITPNSTLQEVFSAIIQKVCTLTDRIVVLENEECPKILVTVPAGSCFRNQTLYPNWNVENQPSWEEYGPNTIPVNVFAELAAVAVCAMLVDITALQSNVASINQQIDDLWFTLENCANQCENLVLPTCTYDFTLNPDGDPVTVQTAFSWLEKDYCKLRGALGTSEEIVEAVSKQCPDLSLSDRLAAGGQMTDLPGWVDTPVTLADSLGNLWLTVCDMRSAVSSVLSGCCFSLCNFLEFGYDLVWHPSGEYVDVVFNSSAGPHLVYTSPQTPTPITSPWDAIPSGPVPAWVPVVFNPAAQSNILITISDGTVAGTLNTGLTVNQWAVASNATNDGYRIYLSGPSISVPGYDKTSINQTIQFQFNYTVNDGVNIETCNIDQIDGFVYECCAPKPYPCDIQIQNVVDPQAGVGLNIKISGIVEDTSLLADSTVTAATSTTLTDSTINFGTAGVSTGANGGSVVYLNYNANTGAYDECRYVMSISGAGNDTLNLDSAWTTTPAPGDTYVVKDRYFSYASNNWQNCNCAYDGTTTPPTSYLLNFTVQVIEINSTYNPNDPSTWNVAVQNTTIPFALIATGVGYPVTPGFIDPNKEYAIAIFANYVCGQSANAMPVANTPIIATVSIQVGSPGSALSNVFQTNTPAVSVSSVLSDNSPLPGTTATPQNIASYGLELPTGSNVTQLRIQPQPPVWINNPNILPKNFCYCGINVTPSYFPGNANVTQQSARDSVLGLYRGYEVSVLFNDIVNNATVPLLDNSSPTPLPYVTDSLSDPLLEFPLNTPDATNGALPLKGGIITSASSQPIPSTYPSSFYPLIVRYDPNKYKVDTSPGFHRVNLTTINITLRNCPFGGAATIDPNLITFKLACDNKKWDANSGTYLNNPDALYNQFYNWTPTGLPLIPPGASLPIAYTPSTPVFSLADYGNWAFGYLTMDLSALRASFPFNIISYVWAGGQTPIFQPLPTSQYSCKVPTQINGFKPYTGTIPGICSNCSAVPAGSGTAVTYSPSWPTIPWISADNFIVYNDALVTEDYDLVINCVIEICGG